MKMVIMVFFMINDDDCDDDDDSDDDADTHIYYVDLFESTTSYTISD